MRTGSRMLIRAKISGSGAQRGSLVRRNPNAPRKLLFSSTFSYSEEPCDDPGHHHQAQQ